MRKLILDSDLKYAGETGDTITLKKERIETLQMRFLRLRIMN
jgi:hypothetical protein